MINAVDIYDGVVYRINPENGFIPTEVFNSASWLAQLSFIDWLTGSSSGLNVPELNSSTKNIDWLSTFIKRKNYNVATGKVTKPDDYYLLDKIFKTNKKKFVDKNGNISYSDDKNSSVDVLSSIKFEERVNTFIDELKPSLKKPIAQMVENEIEFEPSDAGAISLQYIRYPIKALLVTDFDAVYNNEVPSRQNSGSFEWGEYAMQYLIWFIVDEISNHTREQALKQFNASANPKDGGGK